MHNFLHLELSIILDSYAKFANDKNELGLIFFQKFTKLNKNSEGFL